VSRSCSPTVFSSSFAFLLVAPKRSSHAATLHAAQEAILIDPVLEMVDRDLAIVDELDLTLV